MILKNYDIKSITEFMGELLTEIRNKTNSTTRLVVIIGTDVRETTHVGVLGHTPDEITSMLAIALDGLKQNDAEFVRVKDLSDFIDKTIK